MLVVQNINGVPRTIAKVKRKVRLALGLDHNNRLDLAAMQRGWDCLSLFAERLECIPPQNIKIVATATLRLASNADVFCAKGDDILGHRINIISGEQEASLIYHGMAVSSHSADKRLIVDIGGASTELILGRGLEPLVLNSLNMGCVTWLERYFGDGIISQANIEQAMAAAAQVLAPVQQDYLAHHWQLSLGASGSIQAVQEVLVAQELNELITRDKLEIILQQVIACKELKSLSLVGLKPERQLVFVSGLVILLTLFKQLSIDEMMGSGGALREGLIDELIGFAVPGDIRMHCCQRLQQRFELDIKHANQIASCAGSLALQLGDELFDAQDLEMLRYGAMLHEIGTSVEFLQAQRHGHYLLSNTPMAGFSKEQRKLVAALVGSYKNEINVDSFQQQASCNEHTAQLLASCLRLAVILNGRDQANRNGMLRVALVKGCITLYFDATELAIYPLLLAELEQEIIDNNLLKRV